MNLALLGTHESGPQACADLTVTCLLVLDRHQNLTYWSFLHVAVAARNSHQNGMSWTTLQLQCAL